MASEGVRASYSASSSAQSCARRGSPASGSAAPRPTAEPGKPQEPEPGKPQEPHEPGKREPQEPSWRRQAAAAKAAATSPDVRSLPRQNSSTSGSPASSLAVTATT